MFLYGEEKDGHNWERVIVGDWSMGDDGA